jgi:hypothetical protein
MRVPYVADFRSVSAWTSGVVQYKMYPYPGAHGPNETDRPTTLTDKKEALTMSDNGTATIEAPAPVAAGKARKTKATPAPSVETESPATEPTSAITQADVDAAKLAQREAAELKAEKQAEYKDASRAFVAARKAFRKIGAAYLNQD